MMYLFQGTICTEFWHGVPLKLLNKKLEKDHLLRQKKIARRVLRVGSSKGTKTASSGAVEEPENIENKVHLQPIHYLI